MAVGEAGDTGGYVMTRDGSNPVIGREGQCVKDPRQPRDKLFKECGDIQDRDGDGITDDKDKCPDNTPEEISRGVYQDGPNIGSPIDSDNDGVGDYQDKCPNNTAEEISAGVYRSGPNIGCPLDSDEDGVPDYRDRCPNTPRGVQVDEYGCPPTAREVVTSLGEDMVHFAFDRADLTPKGKMVLGNVATYLKNNDAYLQLVVVEGHTDSVGTNAYNKTLGMRRAQAVAKYLLTQGVDKNRLQTVSYGEEKPIADNRTTEGRAKNRRVEIHIRLSQ